MLKLLNTKAGTNDPSVAQFRKALELSISQLVVLDEAKNVKEKDKTSKPKLKAYSSANWDRTQAGQYTASTDSQGETKTFPTVPQDTRVSVSDTTASVVQTVSHLKPEGSRLAYL